MKPHVIHKHLTGEPFVPFRLHVDDGKTYEIGSPPDMHLDMLAVRIGVDPDESGMFRESVLISPLRVCRVEPLS